MGFEEVHASWRAAEGIWWTHQEAKDWKNLVAIKRHKSTNQNYGECLKAFGNNQSNKHSPAGNWNDAEATQLWWWCQPILAGGNFQDDFEGPVEQRRTIIYTMNFEMKVNFYGPELTSPIIREVNTNLNLTTPEGDTLLESINTTPTPIDVSPDGDYGFNTDIILPNN